MKKTTTQQDERLLEYLDGTLSPADRTELEGEISRSPGLMARLRELRAVHQLLTYTAIEQPSRNFAQRVMDHLNQYPVRSGLSIRNALWMLGGVLLAVGAGAFLLTTGIFDTPGSIDLNMFTFNKEWFQRPLPSIPINGKLIVNAIILLNIALAFMVLDRAILRPWFDRRAGLE